MNRNSLISLEMLLINRSPLLNGRRKSADANPWCVLNHTFPCETLITALFRTALKIRRIGDVAIYSFQDSKRQRPCTSFLIFLCSFRMYSRTLSSLIKFGEKIKPKQTLQDICKRTYSCLWQNIFYSDLK